MGHLAGFGRCLSSYPVLSVVPSLSVFPDRTSTLPLSSPPVLADVSSFPTSPALPYDLHGCVDGGLGGSVRRSVLSGQVDQGHSSHKLVRAEDGADSATPPAVRASGPHSVVFDR